MLRLLLNVDIQDKCQKPLRKISEIFSDSMSFMQSITMSHRPVLTKSNNITLHVAKQLRKRTANYSKNPIVSR